MDSSREPCSCRHMQLPSLQNIWLGTHLITVCWMFSGFQWRTKARHTGWGIIGVHWSMTDLCNRCIQRALCKKKAFWINIHDAPVNLITMSKQVRETYYCHFAHHKLNLPCFISTAYEFFNPFFCLTLSPPVPPLVLCLFVLLLSQRNARGWSVSGSPDCIIRTCHFLSGGVNLERIRSAHPGENPGNPDQGGGGEDVDRILWINFLSHFWAGTSEVQLWSTASIASLCD